jgi:tripartite-type tricarboxylate transporter receptor subunit TctC
VVSANTPKEIVTRLNTELKAIMALPEVKKQIVNIGLIPMEPPSVGEMQTFLASEITRWGGLVRQAGIAGTQ